MSDQGPQHDSDPTDGIEETTEASGADMALPSEGDRLNSDQMVNLQRFLDQQYKLPVANLQRFLDQQYKLPVANLQRFLDQQYKLPVANLQRFLDHQSSFARQYEQMFKVAQGIAAARQEWWPANLRGASGLSLEAVATVVMDEGIPLYAVPRTTTVVALLRATSYEGRRRIIGARWQSIVSDCESVLSSISAPALEGHVAFALRVSSAIRDGHPEAAQALAANLLDSMVRAHFAADRIILMPSKKVQTPDGYEEFIARKYVAVAPVWKAFQSFYPSKGDPVPRSFARHASAHAVGTRQFSKRNAVQALMLVSGLLSFLDSPEG